MTIDDQTLPTGVMRMNWVINNLRTFNARLGKEQRRAKYKAMLASAFAFFRGTDHLFWADVWPSQAIGEFGGHAATRTWICGDMHIGNLGVFDNADGQLVYDINDVDETVIADYQFDLWRLVVSMVLAARANHRDESVQIDLVAQALAGYLDRLAELREHPKRVHQDVTASTAKGALKPFLRDVAATSSRAGMLERWTYRLNGELLLHLLDNEDLAPAPHADYLAISAAMPAYLKSLEGRLRKRDAYFTVLGIARRLNMGIGSLGLDRFYVLIRGDGDQLGPDQARILDVKYQPEPASWPYLESKDRHLTQRLCKGDHGRRTAVGQRALGRAVDPHLGWMNLGSRSFSVHERSPYKSTLDSQHLDGKVAQQMGAIVATAHVRAQPDCCRGILDTIGTRRKAFIQRGVALATRYAQQVQLDYECFITKRHEFF